MGWVDSESCEEVVDRASLELVGARLKAIKVDPADGVTTAAAPPILGALLTIERNDAVVESSGDWTEVWETTVDTDILCALRPVSDVVA